MNRIYHLFFLLLFSFICGSIQAQNLIYQKIEQAKNKGEKFDLVKDVFTRTESNKELLRKFKNSEKVSFIKYNTTLYDKLEQTLTIDVPLRNGSITIELEAVDDEFYSYTVTNEKGEAFPANRAIKHYRGVIKNDRNSLVALSFGKESANGIVANANGNFNISSINETDNIVFFQDDNTIYENTFACGVLDNDLNSEDLQSAVQSTENEPLNFDTFKCLRIYFELRYDMFERFAHISTTDVGSRTVGYFSSVFNQVALLYYNAGINAYISELKINTTPDPYPLFQEGSFSCNTSNNYSDNSLCIFNAFGNNLSNNYNGDIAQLISAQSSTSWGNSILMIGSSGQNLTICQVNKKDLFSFAGIGIETYGSNNNLFSNYSWNINVIIHELGHVLGSNHTQSCVWNGNNTPIDNCGPHYYTVTNTNPFGTIDGANCYNSSNPILPTNGGTIMSYCHLLSSVKINFQNGFGQNSPNTPLTRIRGKICANYRCESSYCFANIYIGYADNKSATGDYTVPNGKTDNHKVSNDIYAYHTVESGGYGSYSAGNSIRLLPNTVQYYDIFQQKYLYYTGFHAKVGSNVILKIAPCEPMEYIIQNVTSFQTNSSTNDNSELISVNLYPNPTSNIITIESNYEIIFWELTNEVGNVYESGKINHLKVFDLNFEKLINGVYSIKLHLANGDYSYKKFIKK